MELASNGFSLGIIMDLDPMTAANSSLVSALNATLITYNGNEYMLQNDMGNGRVESAYLPEGFIPVGTTSFGGIIYVASHNPLTGISLIGSFPSPERNFGYEKNNIDNSKYISESICYSTTNDEKYFYNEKYIIISDSITLSPGDLFAVALTQNNIKKLEKTVSNIYINESESNDIKCCELYLGLISEGKIKELSNLKTYSFNDGSLIYTSMFLPIESVNNRTININSYRKATNSPYSIVNGLFTGNLCLIIKLKIIDTFSVGYNVRMNYEPNKNQLEAS